MFRARFRVALCAGAILASAASVPAAGKDHTTWKVKVDGSSFRVTLDKHGVLNVVNKAFFTGRSMDVRDKMRQAVTKATGCQIVDEMWFDAKLKGRISCPDGETPRPPAAADVGVEKARNCVSPIFGFIT